MATITLYKMLVPESPSCHNLVPEGKKDNSAAHLLHFKVLKTLQHTNQSALLNNYTKSTGIN